MYLDKTRPIVLEQLPPEPCGKCEARPVSVCSSISDCDLHRLAQIAIVQNFAPGQSVVEEGDEAGFFFNITAGYARLCKLLPDGRRQITGFPGPGHFLGLAVTGTYGFSIEAITELRVCRFSYGKLRALITDFPAFEARLLKTAQHELVVAQEQMLLLGRKTARERLASFLINTLRSQEYGATPRTTVSLPMTRADIADYLGLTIETVSRSLGKLKAEKLIALANATEIAISDRKRLTAIANGEE